MKKPVILVADGSYLTRRNLHAMPDESDAAMVYTTLYTLSLAAARYRPAAYLITFDRGGSVVRRVIMPHYKASRQLKEDATPEEIAERRAFNERDQRVTKLAQDLLPQAGMACASLPGIEGDDLAYAVAKHSPFPVVMVTDDRDWIASVNAKAVLYRPSRQEEYNLDRVVAEYGGPGQYRLLKAILGKKSEFPGFFKIGPVTGREIVQLLWDETTNSPNFNADRLRVNEQKYGAILNSWPRFLMNYAVSGFEGIYDAAVWPVLCDSLAAAFDGLKRPGQVDWLHLCHTLDAPQLVEKYPALFGAMDETLMRQAHLLLAPRRTS